VTGDPQRSRTPNRLSRTSVVAITAAAAVAVAVLTVVLVEAVRTGSRSWAIASGAAMVVVVAVALAIRAAAPAARSADEGASATPEPVAPTGPDDEIDIEIDLTAPAAVDPLAPVPDDATVLADADAGEFELAEGPTVRVVLHPGPVTRRRLAGRPDALVVTADAERLDVPAWIVEGRSRLIERTDRVLIPWRSIERFRVRAQRDGPGVYDITARPDVPPPVRWRIRRDEITDELALLDHARRVGRVTIELEDSIRTT